MDNSVPKTPEYRHPRWLRLAFACGVAVPCGGLLIAANVFPRFVRGQQHGWPLVYMVRALEDPTSGLSILYGPWPFYDPPLVWFRITRLLIDVVLCVLLTVSMVLLADNWLRARRKRIQFRLLTLLLLTTAASCVAASVTWTPRPEWFVLGILFQSHQAANAILCLVVGATAYRMIRHSSVTWARRRWGRLHWVTWNAVAAWVVSLVYFCLFAYSGYVFVESERNGAISYLPAQGWPIKYLGNLDDRAESNSWIADGFPVGYFNAWALIADIAIVLLSVGIFAFLVEVWVRHTESGRPTPTLAFLLGVLLVVLNALLFGLVFNLSAYRPDCYTVPFWLFGIASTVFFAIAELVRRTRHVGLTA